ncbi:neprilysin-2-like [Cydia pomonella]|uniref:neprilysin-2-like n=1 Tax=Cydia pomonella TaxID=82600 RepID=UPI002ADE3478|nr:neprilysin-2-like [Cydia pomonella]XP_061729221.1 neprilysin-2-like [Cydia pomonella]
MGHLFNRISWLYGDCLRKQGVCYKVQVSAKYIRIDWMDEKTRKSALEKVAAITSHIGYPDELLDDSKLEEFYEKLKLDENSSYLENILDVNLFNKEYLFSQLRKQVNKTHWVSYADVAVINARYYPFQNSMSFTAGIFQDALFNIDRPKYLNYGAIGFVIGHEISHGFDDIGRKFDKDGNVVNWWASSTEKNYLNKVDCIIKQYGNYTIEEIKMKINGINTQGENIADIVGMKTSYLAYTEWAKQNKPEPVLPGVPYTPKQLYWINAANTFCSVIRPEELKRIVSFNAHSPLEFRIRGPMSNLKEFANDFNCPLDSPMNPQHKCVVW